MDSIGGKVGLGASGAGAELPEGGPDFPGVKSEKLCSKGLGSMSSLETGCIYFIELSLLVRARTALSSSAAVVTIRGTVLLGAVGRSMLLPGPRSVERVPTVVIVLYADNLREGEIEAKGKRGKGGTM
jgi:hypothetical protein